MRMRLRRLLGAAGLAIVVALCCGVAVAEAAPIQPGLAGFARDTNTTTGLTSGTLAVATQNSGGTWYAYAPSYYSNELTAIQLTSSATNPTVSPNAPLILNAGTPSGTQLDGADAISVSGGIAYVASRNENGSCTGPVGGGTCDVNDSGTGNALTLFDVSTPTAPAYAGSVQDTSDGGGLNGVTDGGKTLFGADGVAITTIGGSPYAVVTAAGCLSNQPCPDPTVSNDLDVINVSTPSAPTVAGTAFNLGNPTAVAVSGNYAFVTSPSQNALNVVDISNPAGPGVVASVSNATDFPSPSDVAIQGNYAYVVNSGGTGPLTVVNISNPLSPTVVSTTNAVALSGGSRIRVSGDFAYVAASGLAGVTAVDISNPAAPVVISSPVVSPAYLNAAAGLDLMNVSGGEYAIAASPYLSGQFPYIYPPFPAPSNSSQVNTGTISAIQLDPVTNAPALISEPAASTTTTSAFFGFSTSDAVSTVACSLDGSAYAPCTTLTSQQYAGLAVGQHTFTVQATDGAGNTATASYAWTIQAQTVQPPAPSLPANAALPVVNGSTVVGGKLTATTGSWTGSPTSYSYQWQRCNAHGSSCVGLKTTGASYTVGTIDIGDTLRVVVTATNSAGSVAATSAETPVVAQCGKGGKLPAYCRVPKLIARPQVTGTMMVGQPLVATTGSWSTLAASAYGGAQLATLKTQWLRCNANGSKCTAIRGATRSVYRTTRADLGHTLKLQVVAKNRNGTASAASSPSSRIVGAATKLTLAVVFSPTQPLVRRGYVMASVKSNVGAYLAVLFAVKIGHGAIQYVAGTPGQGQAGRFTALRVTIPHGLARQMRAALAHHERMKAAVQGVRFLYPGHNGSQQTREYKFFPKS